MRCEVQWCRSGDDYISQSGVEENLLWEMGVPTETTMWGAKEMGCAKIANSAGERWSGEEEGRDETS